METNNLNNENEIGKTIPLKIPVIVTVRNGLPAIELRRGTTNLDIIKAVVSAAFNEQPLIIKPEFTNKYQSVNSLVEKGIIYKEEDGKYYYLF